MCRPPRAARIAGAQHLDLGYITTPHQWGFGSTCMYEKAPLMGRGSGRLPNRLFLMIVGKVRNREFYPIHLYKNLCPPVLVTDGDTEKSSAVFCGSSAVLGETDLV